jgi:hypothetical protein
MFCHPGPLVRGFSFVVPNLGISRAAEGGTCTAFQSEVKNCLIASCQWLTMQEFSFFVTKMSPDFDRSM